MRTHDQFLKPNRFMLTALAAGLCSLATLTGEAYVAPAAGWTCETIDGFDDFLRGQTHDVKQLGGAAMFGGGAWVPYNTWSERLRIDTNIASKWNFSPWRAFTIDGDPSIPEQTALYLNDAGSSTVFNGELNVFYTAFPNPQPGPSSTTETIARSARRSVATA